MKFNLEGARIFSTYYGGENGDNALDVKVNQLGEVFIIGSTNSISNISTPNSHQESFGGGNNDGYISKFNPDDSKPLVCLACWKKIRKQPSMPLRTSTWV